MVSFLSSFRALAIASLMLALGGCVVDIDYPLIEDLDAGCNEEGSWDLWARVSHPDGPEAVASVWVDVSYVFYDVFDYPDHAYLDTIMLAPLDDAEWGATLPPDDPVLDCDYLAEYGFLFVAEDLDYNQTSAEIIN